MECLINEKQVLTIEQIQQWSYQILQALIYLQEKRLHARNLSLKNIRLAQGVRRIPKIFIGLFPNNLGSNGENSKLWSLAYDTVWHMCHISNWVCLQLVLIESDFGDFSDPYYLAPECFPLDLAFKALIAASNIHLEDEVFDPTNAKSCVWSFGIILLELCLVKSMKMSRKFIF